MPFVGMPFASFQDITEVVTGYDWNRNVQGVPRPSGPKSPQKKSQKAGEQSPKGDGRKGDGTGLTPEYCGKRPQSNESYERENP